MRAAFENDLRRLQTEILKMGSMAETAIAHAILSLQTQDGKLAASVITGDDEVDRMELGIEELCVKLIALQQPLAGDLRVITGMLKICTDIERLADLATNVAEVALRIGKAPLIKPLEDIPEMANIAQSMVRDGLNALVARDAAAARAVCLRDDEVDQMYSQLHAELMEFICSSLSSKDVEQAVDLLFVARQLERIADHATNIAERVIYMVTGMRVKTNQPETLK